MTKLAYDETFSCVQCGYCLPVCPTYLTMGKETHSPRGRINLVKMAAEGKITYEALKDPIELCLGCRACEVVCPTNVQYGKILDSAKAVLNEQTKGASFREFVLGKAVQSKVALNTAAVGLAFYEKSGIRKIAEKTRALNILPRHLRAFAKTLPVVDGPIARREQKSKSAVRAEKTFKVGFFKGCLMDVMFSKINRLSIKLLELGGCDVTVVKDETCCGALPHHNGHITQAKQLAKQNIIAFEQGNFSYIVNSIGGCGAMLSEYGKLFADDATWYERAQRFSEKVIDISVLLHQLPLTFIKHIDKTVTYQPSCHLQNVQKVVNEPLELLQKIPGLTFSELPNSQLCCGSAGDYNLAHYDAAMEILDYKMKDVAAMSPLPEIIVTSNPGCHLQMKMGVNRQKLTERTTVVHLVELVAKACDVS